MKLRDRLHLGINREESGAMASGLLGLFSPEGGEALCLTAGGAGARLYIGLQSSVDGY